MINSAVATPNSTSNIQRFLDFVDQVSEALGQNVPQIVEIEKLRSLPNGTFGRALADFLDSRQLAPLTTGPSRKQLHDSVHVLTGYDTDPVSEAEIQAFLLGAKFRLMHIVIGLGLLRIIHKQMANAPHSPHLIWKRLWCAYQRGRNSQFDIGTWQPELQWELPLTQVQALFDL